MKILFIYKREIKLEDTNVEMLKHPKKLVDRLNKLETEGILEKCDLYKKIEKVEDFKTYWEDIRTLCLYHQDRLVKFELKKKGNVNIHSVIGEEFSDDVEGLIKGKKDKELDELENQAQKFLNSTDLNVDVEFWDQIISRIHVQRAVISLEKLHGKYFEGKGLLESEKLDKKNPNPDAKTQKSLVADIPNADPLSPKPYQGPVLGPNAKLLSEDEYKKRIDTIREKSFQKHLSIYVKMAEKEIEIRKAKEAMIQGDKEDDSQDENGEEMADEATQFKQILKKSGHQFEDDEILFDDVEETKKQFEWIDKFKPRKPHYFNRVRMGYEWNKVNQAHYDLETPPPKQVLGYKFNIFYRNLINKNLTPTYELAPAENPEFCIIKFMAGPPYEDLAFQIVNREWDLSDRQGFKCIFDRGILHLHFNFKLIRYRR